MARLRRNPLLIIFAVSILLILTGLALQAFGDEVCVSAMIQDQTSVTIYDTVCT